MKVLVIGQNAFSKTTNMGKTLLGYFERFNDAEIAQLYLYPEMPSDNTVCNNYYRFTDIDALKSIVFRKICGNRIESVSNGNQIQSINEMEKVYKVGAKHKAWALLGRDLIWKLSNWKNKKMLAWVDEFSPDVIFFSSGDGVFSYSIASYIAEYTQKPLVVSCVDDYYINNRHKNEFLGIYRYNHFMKSVNKVMKQSSLIFVICDTMNREYTKLFEKKCITLHTSAKDNTLEFNDDSTQVSYIGNISHGRHKMLMKMGEALARSSKDLIPKKIDVYTASNDYEAINELKNAQGISFHGSISSEEVLQVMTKSMAVIHTEPFEESIKDLVKYSVSTKIAETLLYGPCLIAYGPSGIASIDYLADTQAAYIITEDDDLTYRLEEILSDVEMRERIINNARDVAYRNHKSEANAQKVRRYLEHIVDVI